MRHLDNRDGLPQSQIWTLLEDRQGFIWAGTSDGLARIGPNGIQLFESGNGLKAKDIQSLLEDHEGAIWVGTQERGLLRFQGRQIGLFGVNEGLSNQAIHCVVETKQGVVLAGTHEGLFRHRGTRFERVPLPEPWLTEPILAMAVDGEGWIWLSSRKGGLARWDGSRFEPTALPPALASGTVVSLRVDPSGQLWAMQYERLLKLTREGGWEMEPLPGLPPVVSLTEFSFGPDGELILVLGSDGLYLRRPDGTHQLLNAKGLPCRDSIICAIRDRHGTLWIGTNGDYLWTQPFKGLHSLTRHPDTGARLDLGAVLCFLEMPGNRMLMGANNGAFLWEDGKGIIQQWHRRDGLVSEDIWALHPDHEGGVWVGTFKGLHRLGPNGRFLPGPKELEKANIQSIVRQGDRLWVGSDKGLAELDSKGRVLALHDPAGSAGGYSSIHCILPREEDLLVGSSFGLLSFKQGAFSRVFPGNPLDSMQIMALHLDKSRRLWVGTSQSLQIRDPHDGSWAAATLEAGGQPLYGITWIRELKSGITAIGHLKGVTLVDPQGQAFLLTRRMGLISDETNQAGALEDQHGRLWIGMVGGVCILDRLDTLPTVLPPVPVVLDVVWEQGSFWLPRDVTLPRGFTNLGVHVDAGSPNTPFPVRFEARLDQGGPWQPLDPGQGAIYFGGLSYGTHRLHFRASQDGSIWRESEPVLLRIQPPWYLSLWAKGALTLLLLAIGIALVRHRFRLLEKNNRDLEDKVQARTRELEVKSQELVLRNQAMEWIHRELRSTLESRMQMINTVSHDLRSPLTTIRLSVDRLQTFAEGLDPKTMKILGVMAHEAERLDAIIKAVLDRNRGDSLADQLSLKLGTPSIILENLEATLTMKAESRGIRCSLSLDPASLDVRILLDPPALQQVLFNLLENALKFTRAQGEVGVRSSICDEQWVLEVWDTGRGIPKHQCERLFHPFEQVKEGDASKGWGLGLYICRSIVEAHGGRIEVESIVAEGSTFRVLLPIIQPKSKPDDVTDVEWILSLRAEASGIQEVFNPDTVGS